MPLHHVIVKSGKGRVTEVLIDQAFIHDVESIEVTGLNGPGPVRVKIELLAREFRFRDMTAEVEACLTATPEKAMIVTP